MKSEPINKVYIAPELNNILRPRRLVCCVKFSTAASARIIKPNMSSIFHQHYDENK